ncbi:MAG: DUF362 domain-containing protein, partial [Candidatus Latescibacteria bacterium]|nr:DUF362 domain-containing protein [Candidatus Latescibacterota bacterium]
MLNRRQFLGAMPAMAAGATGIAGCSSTVKISQMSNQVGGRPFNKPEKSRVEFRAGKNRFEIISDALSPLQHQVAEDIANKQVIVKVNCALIDPELQFCSTHAEQLRAILEFLKPIYGRQIIISEGTASRASSIMLAYENYGYRPLEKEYNIKFIDANDQPTKVVYIRAAKQHPVPINVNYPYMDPNVYLISAARIKTHNAVVATLSTKNVVMGSPQCRYWLKGRGISDKPLMHGGAGLPESSSGRELSYNIFTVALAGVRPDLAVIDGVQTVEGNGPWGGGILVDHEVAIASTDFVAADRISIELMGIDPFYMKYVEWCGEVYPFVKTNIVI